MTLPHVSFVIPTLNSAATLEPCLRSVAEQNYLKKEIVIVDGGSRDSTIEIASKYAARILSTNGPLGLARQLGCQVARGDVLAIFDADTMLPHPDWLLGAVVHFRSDPRTAIVWPKNVAPPHASLVTKSYFHLWEAFLEERYEEDILPGGNSLVLRRAFEEVGGFDVRLQFGEDFDLMRRIVVRGHKVARHGDPIFHDSMRTVREFTCKQIRAASALSKVMSRNRVLGRRLIEESMTWLARWPSRRQDSLLIYALRHVMIGMKWSVRKSSQAKELSWLLVPLLLTIRVLIYSPYYVKGQL